MIDMDEQNIKEILKNGRLNDYESIIREQIALIRFNGFTISARYDSIQSVTKWGSKHVLISLKSEREPFHILWDLFHECGHVLSGEKNKNSDVNSRELLAWEYASAVIIKHPELLLFKNNFDSYRLKCLESYKKT